MPTLMTERVITIRLAEAPKTEINKIILAEPRSILYNSAEV